MAPPGGDPGGYGGAVREQWRHRPHPVRLAPAHPRYAEILAAHDEALAAGDAFYRDPDSGLSVLTADQLATRGTCCHRGCRHCPYTEDGTLDG